MPGSVRGKGRIVGLNLALLPWQRSRKRSLRGSLSDEQRQGQGSHGERHDQMADDQGWFSGKTKIWLTVPDKNTIQVKGFYDSRSL